MKNRMEKYNTYTPKTKTNRTNKNKNLYDDFYTNNTYYDERGSVDNAYEIDYQSSYDSRSDYQRTKDYRQLLKPREINSKEELKKYLDSDEDKDYSLSEVLEKAKKNREVEEQVAERKRKIRNTEYNIFEGATLEDLKKRKEEIDKEKSEIEELINTISSKTLKEDIEKAASKDLLSDLMADDDDDKVSSGNSGEDTLEEKDENTITSSVSKLILDKEEERKKNSEVSEIDRSFYTKSMDLSDEDFEVIDEFGEIVEKKHTFLKVFLLMILFAVVAVALYLIIVGK